MKRLVVAALAKIDKAMDEVLYRPAVVKAFAWLPRRPVEPPLSLYVYVGPAR
jgi:hypothetical protein